MSVEPERPEAGRGTSPRQGHPPGGKRRVDAVPALLEFTHLSGKGSQEILAQLRRWDPGRQ